MLLDEQPRLLRSPVCTAFTAAIRRLPTAMRFEAYRMGVRRYGSQVIGKYIADRLRHVAPDLASKKVSRPHLGSGAHVRPGCRPQRQHNGASPARRPAHGFHGLPALTPVVLCLMSEKRMSAEAISDLSYWKCGLKGLSGLSHDVRELLASADRAKMALDYCAYRGCLPGCWQQRCRGSTASCSRPASARTHLPFVRRWRNG
jgi:hypothetical protein